MERVRVFCWAALFSFILLGCTSLRQIRTNAVPATGQEVDVGLIQDFKCDTGSPIANQPNPIIEDYRRYWIGYAEYDDQGWAHSGGRQVALLTARLKQELNDKRYEATDFQIIVFIHGWHHNAYDNDCNVMQFRSLIKRAADRYAQSELHSPRRVIGIYVGWRGESVDFSGLRYLTPIDRRNSAEHVAKGEVRALFATLRKFEIASNGVDKEDPRRRNRFRSTVIGHSFGALIAFQSLSQAMLSELTQHQPDCSGSNKTEDKADHTWPDLLVLINPAFEASRFEALHNTMRPVPRCPYDESLRPKVLVFTADNDSATGSVFTAGRRVLSVFEEYSEDGNGAMADIQKDANLHAVGFVDRYRTHRLCQQLIGGERRTVVAFTPPAGAKPDQVQDHRAPVWVIGVPPQIIDGHDGFLYGLTSKGKLPVPALLNWIIDLHTTKPNLGLAPDTKLISADGSCGAWPD